MLCSFLALFAGPTDTWRPAIGSYFYFLFFIFKYVKKKIKKPLVGFRDNDVLRSLRKRQAGKLDIIRKISALKKNPRSILTNSLKSTSYFTIHWKSLLLSMNYITRQCLSSKLWRCKTSLLQKVIHTSTMFLFISQSTTIGYNECLSLHR